MVDIKRGTDFLQISPWFDNVILIQFKHEIGCRIYAYCLMTNHVHLVIDPGGRPEAISLLIKRVAGRQIRYFNKPEKRTGSLWEGRFKSSVISTQKYLPACCRYIEFNSLCTGLVAGLSGYKWFRYLHKVKGLTDPVVDLPKVVFCIRADQTTKTTGLR